MAHRLSRFAPLALALALPLGAGAADAERGRILYETRCDSCHAESVHGRAKRAATTFDALRGWVKRWSGNLGLAWTAEEIEDVSVWLNGRYYKFACPPGSCPSTGYAPGAPQVSRAGSSGAS